MKKFYRIRIKTRDLRKVIAIYDTIKGKGLVEFAPAGMFSKYVDVICESDILICELPKAGIPYQKKYLCELPCVDANEVLGYTANLKIDDNGNLVYDLVTKDELNSAIASLRTGDNDKIRKEVIDVLASIVDNSSENLNNNKDANRSRKPADASDVRNIKLQRAKITENQLLNFKLEKRRTKWELIKALQEEFDKLPDETEFNSFSAIGIGIGRSRYL